MPAAASCTRRPDLRGDRTGDLPDTPRDRVAWIAEILLTALTDLGIQATCAPRNESAARQDICFRASNGSEIEVAGVKRIGSAHRHCRWGFLQHASLRLRDDREHYSVLGLEPPDWAGLLQTLVGSRDRGGPGQSLHSGGRPLTRRVGSFAPATTARRRTRSEARSSRRTPRALTRKSPCADTTRGEVPPHDEEWGLAGE